MKKEYEQIIANKFGVSIEEARFHYGKMDTQHIVLYEWENGFAYRAPYKCLNKKIRSIEEASLYIESKFAIKEKRGEYNLFADAVTEVNVQGLEIRELTLQDEPLLEAMKSECDIEEVELAQISIHDYHVLGGFIDGKLIGLSSILDLWGAYDIGIIVHPEYRKRKVSSALVASNAQWVFTQNKVCMYRCDDFNIGSYKTALNLGFKKEVDIVVYELKR